MPNDYHHVHKQRQDSGEAKNNSRIAIEGLDMPKHPDPPKTVIDPWGKDYPYQAGHGEQVKTT
jgi:hypothetical protein